MFVAFNCAVRHFCRGCNGIVFLFQEQVVRIKRLVVEIRLYKMIGVVKARLHADN